MKAVVRTLSGEYNDSMTTLEKLRQNGIAVDLERLHSVAHKYGITELSVFGSSIRRDVSGDSDVDLLVSFADDAKVSLFDLMDLEDELAEVFGRPVDVVEPASLTNPIRRRSILSTKEQLYAA